jgi:hypothetical protein
MILEQRTATEPGSLPATAKRTRKLLSSQIECRGAVIEATGLANRALAILTPDLEPEVYDHDEFLEALKRFILARSFARVRVLIADPTRAIKNGNRFVTMGRRLNSYIEFRNVKPELRGQTEAFLIADEIALVYRPNATSWNGMADMHEPAIARRYLEAFDALWHACEPEPDLRQLSL